MTDITSASNRTYKYFKSLQMKKARAESGEFTVEGIKSVRAAFDSGGEISAVIISDSFKEPFDYGESPVYRVSEPLFDRLCDTKTPQGIMAVVKMFKNANIAPDSDKAYVYCDGLQDPGNVGTIIRTADAAGFDGVIISRGSVDIYAPKTARASMGSFFNIELIPDRTPEDLIRLSNAGFSLIGGALGYDSIDYRRADYKRKSVIIVGNEANGISDAVLKICSHVKIPIYGGAESLNASVASGILMYEWARKNKK